MPRPAKLWRRSGHEGWWATIDGKKVNLGNNHEEAQKKLYARKASDKPVERSNVLTEDLISAYLEATSSEVAATTHSNYRWYLQQFIEFAGSRPAADLRPLDLTAWFKWRVGQLGKRDRVLGEWNAASRRAAIELVRRWSRWCKDQGHLDRDPMEGAKKPRAIPREPAAPGAIDKFMETISDPLVLDLATVLLDTGARPGEIRSLEAAGVNWEQGTADVVGKSGKRTICLTERTMAILRRLAVQHPDGPLLRNKHGRPWTKCGINKRFRTVCKHAGVKVVPYHTRHDLWRRATMAGMDSVVVARQLGHRDMRMLVSTYAHVEISQMRVAVESAMTGELPTSEAQVSPAVPAPPSSEQPAVSLTRRTPRRRPA